MTERGFTHTAVGPGDAAWLLVGALVYLSFGFTEMMGSDLWWHLAAGRAIGQALSPWLVDSWSYTAAGAPWANHEWLADTLFYAWVRAFGLPSLVIWKWGLIVASFCLLQRCAARLAHSPAAALIACALAAWMAAPFLDLRPQLYTLLGTAVLLNLALLRRPRLRELLPLFLLWANLHSGVVFGLLLLGLLLFPWQRPTSRALTRCVVLWASCALVCLLNPHGVQVFALPLQYALDRESPYRGLAEWRPPFESGGIVSGFYPYSLVVASSLAMLWVLPRVRRNVPLRPELLALAGLCAAMSLTSRRFVILWALAFALLAAPFLGAVLQRHALRMLRWPLLLGAGAWALLRLAPYPLQPEVAFPYLTAEYTYPEGIAEYVAANELRGSTFAYYNWGGYLHWRGDGALAVFIDGRANTVFSDETYRRYVSVLRRDPGWIDVVEDSGAQLFLWPRARGGERHLAELRATGRWTLLYEDAQGVLLAHEGFAVPAAPILPVDTPSADLRTALLALRRGDADAAIRAAGKVREVRPWDWYGCTYQRLALQASGDPEGANRVLDECRAWFPSRYLR